MLESLLLLAVFGSPNISKTVFVVQKHGRKISNIYSVHFRKRHRFINFYLVSVFVSQIQNECQKEHFPLLSLSLPKLHLSSIIALEQPQNSHSTWAELLPVDGTDCTANAGHLRWVKRYPPVRLLLPKLHYFRHCCPRTTCVSTFNLRRGCPTIAAPDLRQNQITWGTFFYGVKQSSQLIRLVLPEWLLDSMFCISSLFFSNDTTSSIFLIAPFWCIETFISSLY